MDPNKPITEREKQAFVKKALHNNTKEREILTILFMFTGDLLTPALTSEPMPIKAHGLGVT